MYIIYKQIIGIRVANRKKKEHSQKHAKKIAVFLAKLPLFVVLVIIASAAVAAFAVSFQAHIH